MLSQPYIHLDRNSPLRRSSGCLVMALLLLVISVSASGAKAALSPADDVESGEREVRVHRIIPGDRLEVKVAQDADLNSVVLVDLTGKVQLPLIGTVSVSGLQVDEAAERVRLAYQKDYIIEPTVTVSVSEYGQRRFTVIGRGNKPGDFLFRANKTVNVLQAIAIAGGYSPDADPRKITVKRKVDGREKVFRLNGREMASGQDVKVFALQTGDIVSVSESLF